MLTEYQSQPTSEGKSESTVRGKGSLTLSSRKRRYSLPKVPSGMEAISVRSSVESLIRGRSLQRSSQVELKDNIALRILAHWVR